MQRCRDAKLRSKEAKKQRSSREDAKMRRCEVAKLQSYKVTKLQSYKVTKLQIICEVTNNMHAKLQIICMRSYK